MKKTKVCHVVTMLELGGAQQNTLFTVTNLDRSKFDVSLVCGEGGILDAEAKKIPNLTTYFVPSLVRPVRPWKDLSCLFELISIFKKEKPDIVHTHSSKAGILGRLAARLAGVPIVIHSIHGFGFNPYQKPPVRALFVWLEQKMAQISDCLIAVSAENIREGLEKNIGGPELYQLIRSGVDIQRIKQTGASVDVEAVRKEIGVRPGAKLVLTIGPFKIQKDPVAYIRVAAEVVKSFPDVQFAFAGDGELRDEVEAEIQKLGVEKDVLLLGWRRDAARLLAACDVFAMTSLWEGLPRSGVEALILSKPVVAFAVDGLREIVKDGENGFLLAPGQTSELAQRVLQLLKDDNLRKQFSERAGQSIDLPFDIHYMVRQQENLYEKLLDFRKNTELTK